MLKRIKKILLLSIYSGLGLVLLTQCTNDYPESVFNPDESFKPNPTITQMQPDSAFAGIDEVIISGTNFSTVQDENLVYFNGTKVTILSSDANTLIVRAPNFSLDSVRVQVNVSGALNFAEFPKYKLIPAIIDYSDFDNYDEVYGLAMDNNENLFVSLNSSPTSVVKVGTDQIRQDYTTTFKKSSQMKYGPDGSLFYVYALKYLFRLNSDGTEDVPFAILPGKAYDLDFDQNQNLFCGGGDGGVYRVKMDKSSETKYQYTDVYIHALRVFNNYLYVGGTYSGTTDNIKEGVWRHEITSADGDLGEKELVFDFDKSFVGYSVLSLAFDVDGIMYIGSDAPEGIIVVNIDGTFHPLYEGVMEGEAYAMTWGNSNYLYVNRHHEVNASTEKEDEAKIRILRIDMRKTSAPYYGRN